MPILSLKTSGVDFTELTLWHELQISVREGLGATATIHIDCTGIVALAPDENDRFVLTVPTGEKLQFDVVGTPDTKYGSDGIDAEGRVVVYTYECVDPLTKLDYQPLPVKEYFEATAGEILRDLIGVMDATLDTSGITDGNSVPYLTTEDFSKFSEIVKARDLSTGGYILQLDPSQADGLLVVGNYKDQFGASGLATDYTSPDFSQFKDEITPDNDIVNYQKVRGVESGFQSANDRGINQHSLWAGEFLTHPFRFNPLMIAASINTETRTTLFVKIALCFNPLMIAASINTHA